MEKKKVFSEAAELFDLPADLVAGLAHVEMMGNRYFYMEHDRGRAQNQGGDPAGGVGDVTCCNTW